MSYQQEWTDDFDEASEFDLVDSADDEGEDDPEDVAADEVGFVPDEADPADAADQAAEVPDDEEPYAD